MGSPGEGLKRCVRYLVLGVVGIYVLYGLLFSIAVLSAALAAENDAEAGLLAAEAGADWSREATRSRLQSAPTKTVVANDPRPLGAPSYSWRELTCGIRSVDSGWIAVDFEQECGLVDVDMYSTSLRPSRTTTDSGVGWSVEPNPPTTYSELDPEIGSLGRCGYVSTEQVLTDYQPTWVTIHLGTGRQLEADPGRTRSSCPSDIMAPRPRTATALLSGRRPESLAPDSGWVVVTHRHRVSASRLGCNPWIPFFCTAPLPAPWMPGDL